MGPSYAYGHQMFSHIKRFLDGAAEQATATWYWDALRRCSPWVPWDPAHATQIFDHIETAVLEPDPEMLPILADTYARCCSSESQSSLLASIMVRAVRAGLSPFLRQDVGADMEESLLHHFVGRVANYWVPRQGSKRQSQQQEVYEDVEQALRQWVSIMKQGGINLSEYAAHEQCNQAGWREIWYPVWIETPFLYWEERLPILGLSCGSTPDEWYFWWDHPGDEFAGEFWDMLEHPERAMPGAWSDTESMINRRVRKPH